MSNQNKKAHKYLISLLFILMTPCITIAQQDPMYSQYMFNFMGINPAYAGLQNHTNISFNSRFQWARFEGGPSTNILTINSSMFNERGGLGLILLNDQIGSIKSNEAHIAYSYKIEISDITVRFGLQTGFIKHKFDTDLLTLKVQDDPFFSPSTEPSTAFNFGTGILVKGQNFMAGISVPKILNSNYDINGVNAIQYKRHLYLVGAVVIEPKNGLRIKPMALLRSVSNAPLSLDLNTNIIINNRYWVGLFTTNFKSLGSMFQLELSSSYRFGYSFEFITSERLNSRLSTHELFLSLNFALLKGQSLYQHYF